MRTKARMNSLKVSITNPPKGDHLKKIFEMQKEFGKKFCNFDLLNNPVGEKWMIEHKKESQIKWTKEFIMCCIDELMELLNWLPHKHWKKYKNPKVNAKELKFELVDLFHFFISLCLLWGMTSEELFAMYNAKMSKNVDRQKRGY